MSDNNAVPNYKETIQLPSTAFPMKGDLPRREPEFIALWNEKKIYEKLIQKNQNNKTFAMPDGPPYANGNLHMGHALNKVLKDIVTKYKSLQGHLAPFIPGWDCHGLPIEQNVTKELGPKAREKTAQEIRALCREEALKWVKIQKGQFQRMGIFADWENPYLTMDPAYEAEEIRVLSRLLKTKAFYRGEKPVYWCYTLQTALAEAEVEYRPHKSPSIYVKFDFDSQAKKTLGLKESDSAAAVIWTTTPWTLPSNQAIALHPDFDYGLYQSEHGLLLMAVALSETVAKATSIALTPYGNKTWKGQELENLQARHPFYDRASPLILGNHVTLEAGTGCVHTAPGHGQDDYVVGLKYHLKVMSPVDEAGRYTYEVPEYKGQKIFEANPLIVERLKESKRLLFVTMIEHSYPHNWRSKTPLIFRATPQWFLGMDLPGSEIRKKTLEAIKQVKWVPSWGENRITGMIEGRPDWCLSRQRIWGVPIPVFYCENCKTELAEEKVMLRVADAIEKNGGIDAYYSQKPSDFTEGFKCKKCEHDQFTAGKDILDVWFDSGCCFSSVQQKRKGLTQPADLYLEGSDQHRGWFHTSLLASIASEQKAPFKTVLTHGFVMYAKGQKMSKSLGNVVDPQDLIQKSGADIVRLWAAHEDYAQDLTSSPESFERLSETYRRLRNTLRFLLGNISDFDPQKDSIPYEQQTELDQWMLSELNGLIQRVTDAYDNYEFYKIYHALNQFATIELSAFYLDILKDRLYTGKKTGTQRRSAQTTMFAILETLTGLMAPILSFLAEEAYQFSPAKKEESIFLKDFPRSQKAWENQALSEKYRMLMEFRPQATKVVEELRQIKTIGASLEARLEISAQGKLFENLKSLGKDLPGFFIVSHVDLKEGQQSVQAFRASGEKCVRCWQYTLDIGKAAHLPGICLKCVEALS